ncbi:hypothetical protein [Speluncibacter jeojiensis]|uniref:Uncharacterized protein n=1 Tax=Speluncibacter jeojiensis TaxID=2710754 RepID=A0A9X4M760_9ACTN|nr:hypothetical protein [Corynebacteriales bacterium D3-21]
MGTLTDFLSTGTVPWWAVPVAVFIGVLLGVAGVRWRRKPVVPVAETASWWRPELRAVCVRFLGAADRAHNAIVEVDPDVLAEADLEDAVRSDDAALRALAESILELDRTVNELRLVAPGRVLDAATAFFGFLTAATIDGVPDQEQFRLRYREHKRDLVSATRDSLGLDGIRVPAAVREG